MLNDIHIAIPGLDQAGTQLVFLHGGQLMRSLHMGHDHTTAVCHQCCKGVHHGAQGSHTAVRHHDADEIQNRLGEGVE